MPKNPNHARFFTANVGDSWLYPFEQLLDGKYHRNTRANLNSVRAYYQDRLNRRFSLRADHAMQCFVMTRQADDYQAQVGRPRFLGVNETGRTQTQLSNARRQAAYRARLAARFAHAFSPEGWRDQAEDLVAYRKRAAFQLANTAAVAEQAWRQADCPASFEFKLTKRHIGEVHPNPMRAANLVEQKLAQALGVPVTTEHSTSTVAGKVYEHFMVVINEQGGQRRIPGDQEVVSDGFEHGVVSTLDPLNPNDAGDDEPADAQAGSGAESEALDNVQVTEPGEQPREAVPTAELTDLSDILGA